MRKINIIKKISYVLGIGFVLAIVLFLINIESMLDYLSEEHEIDLRTDDIHWMMSDNAIINIL